MDVLEFLVLGRKGHLGSCKTDVRVFDVAARAKPGHQFGKQIGKFQSVSNRIVDMMVRIETSRNLIYRYAWLKDQGKEATIAASMAKLHVSEAFVQNSLDAIRIFGDPVLRQRAREVEELDGDLARLVDTMYRMKMYFEDAGKWAFMKNMGMPGSIHDEIAAQIKAGLGPQ